ncbi:MAG: hypothetical protein PQJ46_05080 [Spirochaetales bacterium]|nr:hypothetical protein [Spirochaetales bacterium]
MSFKLKLFISFLLFIPFSFCFSQEGFIDSAQSGFSYWTNFMDMDESLVERKLTRFYGLEPVEINPSEIKSKAERVIWYKNGPTVWFISGRAVQLRLSVGMEGLIDGVGFGSSVESVKTSFGNPWIETENDLYYNLPWKGGPLKLRLYFKENALYEAYLYIVR